MANPLTAASTPDRQSAAIPHVTRAAVRSHRSRRWIVVICLMVGVALLSQLYRSDTLSYEQVLQREQALRQFMGNHPVLSFCIGFSIYTVVSMVPGTTGKSILFGWLFGFWFGLIIVCCSLTIAGTFGFLLSRYLFRDIAQHKLGFIVRRIDQTFARRGPIYLVMLRVLHLPYTPLNYAMGASSISTRTFAWTTLVGMLPGNIAFVLAGSQLPTLAGVSEAGVWSVVDFRVFAALSIAALIPLVARQVAIHFKPSNATHCGDQQEVSSNPLRDDRSSQRMLPP